jgi:hypothetical protein
MGDAGPELVPSGQRPEGSGRQSGRVSSSRPLAVESARTQRDREREARLRRGLDALLSPGERLVRLPPARDRDAHVAFVAALVLLASSLAGGICLIAAVVLDLRWWPIPLTFLVPGPLGWLLWRASLRRVVLTDRRLIVFSTRRDGRRMWSRTIRLVGGTYVELHEWSQRMLDLGTVVIRDDRGKRVGSIGPVLCPSDISRLMTAAIAAIDTPDEGDRQDPIRLFICYRQQDSQRWAGPVKRQLERELPGAEIFLDTDDFRGGSDYRAATHELIPRATVLLVFIGPAWVEQTRRRQASSDYDPVLDEIQVALAADVPIIPVLLDAAERPLPASLPDPIKSLVEYRIAIRVPEEPYVVSGISRIAAHVRAWDLNRSDAQIREHAGWDTPQFPAILNALSELTDDLVAPSHLFDLALHIKEVERLRRILALGYAGPVHVGILREQLADLLKDPGKHLESWEMHRLRGIYQALNRDDCVVTLPRDHGEATVAIGGQAMGTVAPPPAADHERESEAWVRAAYAVECSQDADRADEFVARLAAITSTIDSGTQIAGASPPGSG